MPLEPSVRGRRTPQAAAFHFSRLAAWSAIAVIWSITPLSWLYMLWTLLTLAPPLHAGRPAPNHLALAIVHYTVLAYCALEIPFSIAYRWLAIRANRRRPAPRYTRKFLRSVIKRSLEDGLSVSDAEEEAMDELAMGELSSKVGQKSPRRSQRLSKQRSGSASSAEANEKVKPSAPAYLEMRKRSNPAAGDGSLTPELNDLRPLPRSPARQRATTVTTESSTANGSTVSVGEKRKACAPSFISTPLEFNDPRSRDFRNWIRQWFNGCEYDEIYRDNMADWLAWSLYGQPLSEIVEEREAWHAAGRPPMHVDGEPDIDDEGLDIEQDKLGLVDHCIDMIEARAAKAFRLGRNHDVKVIRLTLDPVKVRQRPLILYTFVFTIQKTLALLAQNRGFKEIRDGPTRYLLRIPPGWTPNRVSSESKRPLLFIHGLGMGLAQYMTLVNYLSTASTLMERPIVILLQPHISMSLFSRNYLSPPSESTMSEGIEKMARKHGFEQSGMTVLSHSNGTIVHGWLLKNLPNLVTRSCFVDPVCFCLWDGIVCGNFLYAKPRSAIEYLMRYFVSRELGIALMLQRTFDWSANLLFPTDIPNLHDPFRSAFFLAGRDSILDADRVRKYLVRHDVREVKHGEGVGRSSGGLKLFQGKKHGESMIGTGAAFDHIMAWVSAEEDEGGLAGGESSSFTG